MKCVRHPGTRRSIKTKRGLASPKELCFLRGLRLVFKPLVILGVMKGSVPLELRNSKYSVRINSNCIQPFDMLLILSNSEATCALDVGVGVGVGIGGGYSFIYN